MAKSRKSKGKAVELTVATTSLIDSSKGVEGDKAVSAGQTPALKPQDHGGALLVGGQLGNKGGGRTPDELRALFRQPIAKLLPVVERIAEAADVEEVSCPHCDEKVEVPSYRKDGDKLKAVDLLARYGIGTKQEVDIKGRVTLVADTGSLSD